MSCADYQERASLLLDGFAIAEADRTDLQHHLKACTTCDLDLAIDRATRTILRQRFPIVETPVTVRESLQLKLSQYFAI